MGVSLFLRVIGVPVAVCPYFRIMLVRVGTSNVLTLGGGNVFMYRRVVVRGGGEDSKTSVDRIILRPAASIVKDVT